MRSIIKNIFILVSFILMWGYLNNEYLAETKKKSIINLFCIENFKEEMLKGNISYQEEIARETCNCYLKEFFKTNSHQKSINKCKLEAKNQLNL